MNKKFLSTGKIAGSEKGALLLSVIVIIVVFAVLGTAILSITSTSTFTQVYGNHATKAYYMAESGFRYATMNIMTISIGGDDCLKCHSSHGKETLRYSAGYGRLPDDTIKVHEKRYNDKDFLDGGSFEVALAPFWFKAGKDSLTGTQLTVFAVKHSTGAPQCDFPEAFTDGTITGGGLYIGDKYVQYSAVVVSGDGTLIFTVVNPDDISLPEEEGVLIDVFPACEATGPTVSEDGKFLINVTGELYAFPDTKSVIEIHSTDVDSNPVTHLVTYENVENVDANNGQLTGLGDVDALDPVVADLDVKAGDIVTLSKTLKITSTGRYPDTAPDVNPDAAKKTLKYYRWVGKPMTVPIVYNTAKPYEDKLLAGGNFHWVEYENDNRGHNIFQDNGDDKLDKAPGTMVFTYGPCVGCHANLHLSAKSPGFPELDGRSGCKVCHFDPHPSDWYRFVSIKHWDTEEPRGAEGIEHEKWNYEATPSSHNEYLGTKHNIGWGLVDLGNTTTAYCTGCHGAFHNKQKDDDGKWTHHPSDWTIPNLGEFADAFGAGGSGIGTYDSNVPVARTSLAGGVSSIVMLDSDMVMCLSCHHAHGSPYDDSLRWDTNSRDSSTNKCLTCHTQKTLALHHSESTDCRSCHTMHDGKAGLLKP